MNITNYPNLTPELAVKLKLLGIDTDADLAALGPESDRRREVLASIGVPDDLFGLWCRRAAAIAHPPLHSQQTAPMPAGGANPAAGDIRLIDKLLKPVPLVVAALTLISSVFAGGMFVGALQKEVKEAQARFQLELDNRTLKDQVAALNSKAATLETVTQQFADATKARDRLLKEKSDLEADKKDLTERVTRSDGQLKQLEQKDKVISRALKDIRDKISADVEVPRELAFNPEVDPYFADVEAGESNLTKILDDPKSSAQAKFAALERLITLKSRKAMSYLVETISRKDVPLAVRDLAANYLDRFAPEAAARDALLELLDDPDANIQRGSINSLVAWKGDQIVRQRVEEYMLDPSRTLENRGTAASTLRFLKLPEAVPSLVKAIRQARQDMLGAKPEQRDGLDKFLRMAISAFGDLPSHEAVPLLIELLSDNLVSGRVKATAATALGYIPDAAANREVERALRVALNSNDNVLRGTAVTACGKLGFRAALKDLIQILDSDPDADIRGAAATSIHRIFDKHRDTLPDGEKGPVVAALLKALQSQHREVRGTAITSLGRVRDPAAIDPLIDIAKDPQAALSHRAAAAASLSVIGDKRAGGPLIELMLDPNCPPRLVGTIAVVLAAFGDGSSLPSLVDCAMRIKDDEAAFALGVAILVLADESTDDAVIGRILKGLPVIAESAKTYVVLSLGRAGDFAVQPALAKLANDPQEVDSVRVSAIMALVKKRELPTEVRQTLETIVRNADQRTELSEMAAVALGETLDPEAWQKLKREIKNLELTEAGESANFKKHTRDESTIEDFFDEIVSEAKARISQGPADEQ